MKLKNQHYPVIIAVTNIPELLSVERTLAGVQIGASTTLTTLKEVLQELVNTEPGMTILAAVDDQSDKPIRYDEIDLSPG